MLSVTMTGAPGNTVKHSVVNTAETLDDVTGFDYQRSKSRTHRDGTVVITKENVTGVLITCEANSIRFTFNGITPTNDAGTAVGHILAATYSLKLTNHSQIANFSFINKVSASVAILQITPEYSSVS